jgi:phosphomannomutase/phosphoglucomutase
VVVGRDGRVSSKSFSRALIDGITAMGVNVIDIGEVPSPLVYFALNTLKVDGGIMLTASHNPGNYNGLKIGVGKTTIYGDEIQNFRKIVEKGGFEPVDKPVTITRLNLVPKYAARILKDIKLKRKLKVVVDGGNGVGGPVGVPIFEALGCEVIPLYCDVDGRFPNHHPDPTQAGEPEGSYQGGEEAQGRPRHWLRRRRRPCRRLRRQGQHAVGRPPAGALCAVTILKEKPGATIIGEVKCSRSFYEDVKKHGGKAVMWRTGHSHIKAAMKDQHAELAGEMSGHIFFKHRWYGFDDAVYSAARLLEIVAAGKKTLSPSTWRRFPSATTRRSSISTARTTRNSRWWRRRRPISRRNSA